MEARDAAEYHEASCPPEISDRPEDIIRDAVREAWKGPMLTVDDFAAPAREAALGILRGLRDSGALESFGPGQSSPLLPAIIGEILAAPNPALMAHCAAIALDLGIIADSETEIARRFGVTKAAVSHTCRYLVETYRNGKPARGMKSEAAVASYTEARIGKCAKQAAPWELAERFQATYSCKN